MSNSQDKPDKKQISEYDKARLSKVLEVLREQNIRFPVAEIVKRTGFKKGHVSNVLNSTVPMSDNFYDTFLEKFCANENVINGEIKKGTADQTIFLLSESNRKLADIIIKQTDVHYEEARTNRVLAEINSGILAKIPNLSKSLPALQDFSLQLSKVIEQMALKGVPEQWKSFEEGRAILDKLLAFDEKEMKSKGTDHGKGKQNR